MSERESVYVCVCERERERRERGGGAEIITDELMWENINKSDAMSNRIYNTKG